MAAAATVRRGGGELGEGFAQAGLQLTNAKAWTCLALKLKFVRSLSRNGRLAYIMLDILSYLICARIQVVFLHLLSQGKARTRFCHEAAAIPKLSALPLLPSGVPNSTPLSPFN